MTDDPTADERAWRESAGRALRASENTLDAMTLMRLRAARARAVSAAQGPDLSASPRWRWAVPAALAAGLLAVVVAPRLSFTPGAPAVNVAEADTLEVLTDEMGPEFYENMDLYLWLEESGGSA